MSEDAFERARRIDEAVDHLIVAEAAEKGVLPALVAVLARCEGAGVPDVTVAELVRAWRCYHG